MANPAPDSAKGTQPASEGLEVLQEVAPGEEGAAPAPGEWKYCLLCHEQIRSSVRACPYCGTKVVLYEGGDREPRRFFLGSLLLALGALLPWGTVPEQWLGDLARPAWLLLGLWGVWRMWVAIVARRVTVGALLLQVLPFFWGIRFALLPLFSAPETQASTAVLDSLRARHAGSGLPDAVRGLDLRLELVGIGPLLVFLGSLLTILTFVGSISSAAKADRAKKAAAAEKRQAARTARGK